MQASHVFAPPTDRIVSSYCRSFNNTCHTIGKLIKQDRSLLTRYRGKHQMEMKSKGNKKCKEKERERERDIQREIHKEKQGEAKEKQGNQLKSHKDFVIKNMDSIYDRNMNNNMNTTISNQQNDKNVNDPKNIDKFRVVQLINVIRAKIYPNIPPRVLNKHRRYQSAFIVQLPQRPPSAFLQRQSPKVPKQLIFKKMTMQTLNQQTLTHSRSMTKSEKVPITSPLMYLQPQKKQMQLRTSHQYRASHQSIRPATSAAPRPTANRIISSGRLRTQQNRNRQRRLRTQSSKQIDQLGAWNTEEKEFIDSYF